MGEAKEQSFWAPSGATVRLPPRMRLARAEQERLWKGLERFVNCGDDPAEYQALGRAFLDFWPSRVWHYPNQTTPAPVLVRVFSVLAAEPEPELDEEQLLQKMKHEGHTEELAWHLACHKLFLFYRDSLRQVWCGEPLGSQGNTENPTPADLSQPGQLWVIGYVIEFLLGLMDYNEEARQEIKNGQPPPLFSWPYELFYAWQGIIRAFPTAAVEGRVQVSVLWEMGDFSLVPHNDFQRAFYLLFRQSWRARVCPRCKMFFVARKPKQIFCGTGCSAGSRLASKRRWWKRVGAKKRTGRIHRNRKRTKRDASLREQRARP
jgi:hypothetical protein